MTDHVRKQIRDAAAATTVLGNLTTTGPRVFTSRVHPMLDNDLPGLRIYTREEASQVIEQGSARLRERLLELVVEGCAKQVDGCDDLLDTIAKEVETALDGTTLGGRAKMIEPRGYELELAGEGERPVAVGRMKFEVTYHTRRGAPDVAA